MRQTIEMLKLVQKLLLSGSYSGDSIAEAYVAIGFIKSNIQSLEAEETEKGKDNVGEESTETVQKG